MCFELGLLCVELSLNRLDILDGIAVALVDLLNVMRVGDEFLKRARGQQQRQDVRAAGLVAGGHAIGKVVALLLELGLLFIDLGLRVVNLAWTFSMSLRVWAFLLASAAYSFAMLSSWA